MGGINGSYIIYYKAILYGMTYLRHEYARQKKQYAICSIITYKTSNGKTQFT